jgi:uncharacterized phage-associated protein
VSTAATVARYIVRFFQEAGDPVSNLKLQKLLYYCQGWHLAIRGSVLFEDRLEAWVHGPVQPSVYGTYKHNRWMAITGDVDAAQLDADEKSVVDEVLEVYGADSGYELELRTHMEAPWVQARDGIPRDQESRALITTDSMKKYFESLRQ